MPWLWLESSHFWLFSIDRVTFQSSKNRVLMNDRNLIGKRNFRCLSWKRRFLISGEIFCRCNSLVIVLIVLKRTDFWFEIFFWMVVKHVSCLLLGSLLHRRGLLWLRGLGLLGGCLRWLGSPSASSGWQPWPSSRHQPFWPSWQRQPWLSSPRWVSSPQLASWPHSSHRKQPWPSWRPQVTSVLASGVDFASGLPRRSISSFCCCCYYWCWCCCCWAMCSRWRSHTDWIDGEYFRSLL